jgi:glutamate racemase
MTDTKRAGCRIGIFDSGVGGLTVMKQIIRLLPHADIVYFGDTARLPYGGKSPETITRYSIENAIFLLKEESIQFLVVACNTASACAIGHLQQIFNIPIVGTIMPGAEKSVEVTRNGRIAIIGTKATIASGAYQREIQQLLPNAQLFPIACPLFVPLVEEQFVDHDATKMVIQTYLEPLIGSGVDTLLLGCTHYPLLREVIQEVVGEGITLVDPASSCAEAVSKLFSQPPSHSSLKPEYRYFVSDDPHKFQLLGEKFLCADISDVRLANNY